MTVFVAGLGLGGRWCGCRQPWGRGRGVCAIKLGTGWRGSCLGKREGAY